MKGATYTETAPAELWWCNSHKRRATHICRNETREWHCCDPALGGIMLPCFAVDLTGAVEIEEAA